MVKRVITQEMLHDADVHWKGLLKGFWVGLIVGAILGITIATLHIGF